MVVLAYSSIFNPLNFVLKALQMIIKRGLLALLLCGVTLCTTLCVAQTPTLSNQANISVITCGPGNELYSAFGHSALRVTDPNLGIDVVYNYGTFDFNTPNFYIKFARGKLLYTLSRTTYDNFIYAYILENRWAKQQELNLSSSQKNAVFQYLEQNYRPENREYTYDFFFNNCATKIESILSKALKTEIIIDSTLAPTSKTFRNLIGEQVAKNSWAGFGIDLALGAVIDKKATLKEQQFLPNYVFNNLAVSSINNKPLVNTTADLHKPTKQLAAVNLFRSPAVIFFTALIIIVWFSYKETKNHRRNRWLDFGLFAVNGIAGFIILLLWFATDHSATALNFNCLWLFPMHLFAAFSLLKKGRIATWVQLYTKISLIALVIVVVLWALSIQQFNWVNTILMSIFALRYYRIINFVPERN